MRIPIQALLAFGLLFFSGGLCAGEETLLVTVSANPSTFKSVGETITFTYDLFGEDYIATEKQYSVTDDAADAVPICSTVSNTKLYCTAVHTITAADVALGYVTSHAVAKAHVGMENVFWTSRDEILTTKATTVVYIINFVPSPTPTVTPLVVSTPSHTPNPAANAEVIFEKGNTTDLLDCSGTEFGFTVKDPEGIQKVYIEFAVAGFDTDFSTIAGTLDLTNTGGDTWSGTLNDTFSSQGQVTYWPCRKTTSAAEINM